MKTSVRFLPNLQPRAWCGNTSGCVAARAGRIVWAGGRRGLWVLAAVLLLTGCTITKKVTAVPAGARIQAIHVVKNDKVLYKQDLFDELLETIREQGFEARPVLGEKPRDAAHVLEFSANWNWDMAMYLTFFHATLWEGEKVLGEITYDATRGGGRMDKFGTTGSKVRPLMAEMLKGAERPARAATNSPAAAK